ncbi:permease [Shewanella putrefaciens]|uniref:Permease n=1 Tax=Shewanella putrefaciens (strain CN-32 / ATCC BAA-453) TaxID=319224 RepID=A4Y4R2_SHEPC|nr:permease [Shewanella putrefaciens]QGS50598.1 permease [Shewanella putrefaciens]
MNPETLAMLKETANMFVFLAVELTLLFLAISYLVGILQAFITPHKIQALLSSRNGKGYVVAALLGSITPFCSCSTIPFLKGLLRARAGFGPMMVFLFASPLLNPIIIGLFVVTFGFKVALFYFVIAMGVSVIAGFALEKLGFEKYVREEAYVQIDVLVPCCNTGPAPVISSCCYTKPAPVTSSCCNTPINSLPQSKSRWLRIWQSTWNDFKKVLPYLFVGVLLGSLIYGFIPTDFIVHYAGEAKWYAIPAAALIGIPLYIRAEAVIPLSAALIQKGMAMGSVMALIIGSAGASLTEVILLKAIFKNQMIAAFLAVILGMAIGSGFLYSYVFS